MFDGGPFCFAKKSQMPLVVYLALPQGIEFYSPSPNTPQLAARMKVRRTLHSLGEGGWKGFGEFRKDTSELCSEELHLQKRRDLYATVQTDYCWS